MNYRAHFTAPLSLLTTKDRRNKHGQQSSHASATGKHRINNPHFPTLLISLVLLPALALVSNTRLGDL
ncbi:hypothetical protein Hanom_Chr06g00524661 [Helianthus anomalus]